MFLLEWELTHVHYKENLESKTKSFKKKTTLKQFSAANLLITILLKPPKKAAVLLPLAKRGNHLRCYSTLIYMSGCFLKNQMEMYSTC